MEHDTPIYLYIARLIDAHGYVPYRDIYEYNLPGTYLINILIGRIAGYANDPGLRVFDLSYLSMLLAATWFWLRTFGWRVAWCAVVLFGLAYLSSGSGVLMQREFLALLPVVCATALVSTPFPKMNSGVKGLLVGLLFGLAATIKLQFSLGLPVILAFQFLGFRERRTVEPGASAQLFPLMGAAIVGFSLPIAAIALYLVRIGALSQFTAIATNYWPIYSTITNSLVTSDLVTVSGWERVWYLFMHYLMLGSQASWLIPATVGLFAALLPGTLDVAQRRQAWLITGLTAAYSLYPAVGGQFFDYHWLPFRYFIIILTNGAS